MFNEPILPTLPNSSFHISGVARKAKADAVCGLHLHNEFELFTVVDGKTEFYVNDIEYKLTAGDIIFINNRVPHWTSIHKDSSAFFVQFDTDINPGDNSLHVSKYLSRFINYNAADVVFFKCGTELNRELHSYLMTVLDEYREKKTAYEIYIKASLYNILATLYRHKIVYNPNDFFQTQDVSKILPVLDYIDMHYREQISLSDLSGILNINEQYFCRLFKKIVNTTFVQYLNFVRVCKAERLLMKGEKSISEISYETGFSSVSYFNRTFKKFKLCTPSYYKKIKYDRA